MNTPIGLNVFQRLLRRWDLVHPYNAGQVLRVAGGADLAAWQQAWDETLDRLSLGAVEVLPRDRFRFTHPAPSGIDVVPDDVAFEQHVTTALNTRFVDGQVPFRPFLKAAAGEYWIGVIYSHWVADSVSIRMLLREWFLRVIDPSRCRIEPIVIARQGYWATVGPDRVPWRMDEAVLNTIRSFSRFRQVRRLAGVRSDDYAMSFLLRDASPGIVPQLRQFARASGVTVHDVFLAAAIEQCAAHLPLKRTAQRRDVALGSIVDLRAGARGDLSGTFGMFLGFANVVASAGHLHDFPRLLRALATQTRHGKRTHATAAGTVWLYVSMVANRFLPPERSYQFYRKHMPLAGGISNVNLAGSWAAAFHPSVIRQYVRISPTGPMIPVAFTPTSLGDDLHLAMTYRAAVLPHESAARMADGFLRRVTSVICG